MKITDARRVTPQPVAHEPTVLKRVLIAPGEAPGLAALQCSTLQPGQSVAPHRHPDKTEIFYGLAGAGKVVVDGRELDLHPGICLRVDPGELHAFSNPGPAPFEFLVMGLMPDDLPPRPVEVDRS